MAANQSQWPREWLMTDERIGQRLWEAIEALPTGAGIVFRHYATPTTERRRLGLTIADACRQRRLVLAVAGDAELAEELGASLVHNPARSSPLPCSMAVHDERQAEQARRAGAALVFVGPVHATRSHPDKPGLGADRAAILAHEADCPAIALGGMDAARFDALQTATSAAFHGYAGIDCWLRI